MTVTLSSPPRSLARSMSARQPAAGSSWCARTLQDVAVLDHAGQAVRAEQEQIAQAEVFLHQVRLDLLLTADRVGQDVARRVAAGLLAAQRAGSDLLVHERVVGGQLAQGAVAHEIGAAVAEMADEDSPRVEHERRAGRGHPVDGGILGTAISQVVSAASRDDTLPMLTGVCLDIDGEILTLAATDRYRLAVREMPWEPVQPGLRAAALVPARTLPRADRASFSVSSASDYSLITTAT